MASSDMSKETSATRSKSDSNDDEYNIEKKYIDQGTLELEKRVELLLNGNKDSISNSERCSLANDEIPQETNTSPEDSTCRFEDMPDLPEVPSDHNIHDKSTNDEDIERANPSSSAGSSRSLSKSYLYSSVSVDGSNEIPQNLRNNNGDKQLLFPKYNSSGTGYCWPITKLPLSGRGYFHENSEWKSGSELGSGASGQCFIGSTLQRPKEETENNIFCVKKLHKYNREEVLSMLVVGKDQHAKQKKQSGSENIILFYGATFNKDVCIFMELMEGGTVDDLLHKEEFKDTGLPKIDYLCFLKDVLSGLAFLHSKGWAHKDIKSANILLPYNRLQAKLADFGNASPIYNNDNSMRIDFCSAGCFLLEMLGKFYDQDEILKLKLEATQGSFRNLKEHSDQDTNTLLQSFFRDNTTCNVISVAMKCEEILNIMRVNEQMNERVNEQMNERVNEQMNELN